MKISKLMLTAVAIALAFASCQKELDITNVEEETETSVSEAGEVIPGQYIVVLNEETLQLKSTRAASYTKRVAEVKAFAESIISENPKIEFEIIEAYAEAIKGFCVNMPEKSLELLKQDKRVKFIEQDIIMTRPPWENPDDGDTEGQEVPYGIERVGYGSGAGKVAWIIDSGIDLDHPDLNVDVNRSRDFTGSRKGAEDENGHGTHCAGIVAAIDNEIGVVGIASGATVVAVRVLDKKGSGATSGVIAGVDYVASAASPGDAANMSLGGGVSDALDAAVLAASENGIYFSLAAGNESDDATNHSPARVNGANIWTISAMDSNDTWAYFSNYGNPPVDYCEPGVSILSTYKEGGYATMSGTSMAAPHMCGILLMTNGDPNTSGTVSGDPDGDADPIGHI